MRSVTHIAMAASSIVGVVVVYKIFLCNRKHRRNDDDDDANSARSTACSAYERLIGSTPMVRLPKLSALLSRKIYVKMESLNPGGTGKDRAALNMIRKAEQEGLLPTTTAVSRAKELLQPIESATDPLDMVLAKAVSRSWTGGLVVEGTSGSTGISLATLSVSRGHACLVVMPDDQAHEKQIILKTLGAVVHVVPNAAISNPNHYVNIARRLAERARTVWGVPAIFTNQFENQANFEIHYHQTGPEIMRQCPDLDAFVMSSGTGGTISGVGRYLKENVDCCKVVLVDPPGSALYNKIMHGVAYASQQSERVLRRHRYDTLAEGIGLDRVTHNLALGVDVIDSAIRVTDQEAVDFAHWLLHNEGLWVGSSSAMNLVGAVWTALELPEGAKVVTAVCDNGNRHLSRFWNRDFCLEWGLQWPEDAPEGERIPECLQQAQKLSSRNIS